MSIFSIFCLRKNMNDHLLTEQNEANEKFVQDEDVKAKALLAS